MLLAGTALFVQKFRNISTPVTTVLAVGFDAKLFYFFAYLYNAALDTTGCYGASPGYGELRPLQASGTVCQQRAPAGNVAVYCIHKAVN